MSPINVKRISNDQICINPNSLVKVTEQGKITEIMYMSNPNHSPTIRMLPDSKYLVISTGEIKDCVKHKKRIELTKNLMRTFRNLKAIINTNVIDLKNVRWLTLTYRLSEHEEPMTDTVKLMKDFEKFNKKFQYFCKKNNYGNPEYIAVAEPQGSGAWHMHLLYIFGAPAPYIDNDSVLFPMWSHGWTKIKALHGDISNIGVYLTAYLTDMDMSELDNLDKIRSLIDFYSDDDSDSSGYVGRVKNVYDSDSKTSKSIIKGARLAFYPSGFRIYRTSRGIVQPTAYYTTYDDISDIENHGRLLFEKSVLLEDESTDFESYINKKYYRID